MIRFPIPMPEAFAALQSDAQVEVPDDIAASRPLLPADTRWVAIEGGNHAQFGWYGPQAGDAPATISRQEQQRQIVVATLEVLAALNEGGGK